MKYFCCEERRRNAVKLHPELNGIDFLEVSDDPRDPIERRQRTLFVHFLKDVDADAITIGRVLIEGGERIRNIKVTRITGGVVSSPPSPASPPAAGRVLAIEVSEPGDFSIYTLRLLDDVGRPELGPPDGFDQLLSAVDFSFKVACPSDFDCRSSRACPPPVRPEPEINYLAKDYASFRQLMLDRLAVLTPSWTERNAADLGIAFVELLAYAADYLSYQQDSVATEAYLATARRRTSVRRHARLVDYFVFEGCTARVWIQFLATREVKIQKTFAGFITSVATKVPDVPGLVVPDTPDDRRVRASAPDVFELVNEITAFREHNEMRFYTWGSEACCLPKGATRATLRGAFPGIIRNLQAEAVVLILAEVLGPETGDPDDADPRRRHAVRLTKATVTEDRLGGRFNDPPDNDPVSVTEIEWHVDDALPFPLCVSSRQGTVIVEDVSVAWGNVALADYGATEVDEALPEVPAPDEILVKATPGGSGHCDAEPTELPPPRFRPNLQKGPVTHVAVRRDASSSDETPYGYGLADARTSAHAVMAAATRSLPAIQLRERVGGAEWIPRTDLLSSGPDRKEFVVEVEGDRSAYLRFGDDRFGSRPSSHTQLMATYRVGNGTQGNVGAGTLVHLISSQPEIVGGAVERVRNPLPARGGTEPESLEQVRQRAPVIFRNGSERAVTPPDYAANAETCRSDVQKAAGTFRWTGSWRTVFLTVDRRGGERVDEDFKSDLRRCLERFRMAGHDLAVDSPAFVPLELEMLVCTGAGYMVNDVRTALLGVFTNGIAVDGRKGLFHADHFSFGQPVYLSPFYAAAQAVAGVDRVQITKFQRVDQPGSSGISSGRLDMRRLEIARLDNDPNFRERGVFTLTVQGAR